MPLPIQFQYSDVADKNAYETYATSSFGDVLGATWDDATEFNPTVAATNLLMEDDPTADMLDPATANEKYSIGSLSFDAPVLESTAKRLYGAKYGEIKRSEIMRTGPQGFGVGLAKFGTTLAASAIDPLNIASAFFPSFAISKAAQAMKMAEPAFIAGGGSVAARAAGGALEGAVGAAMLEPLPYLSAKKNQLEYDMGDSMLNIAIGGALGGGLHAAGRALEIRGEKIRERKTSELTEMIDSLPPDSKMRLMKSAFSEISEGGFPVNASRLLAREILANQPHGLTDFTFRVDGSLSLQNQTRLARRGGTEAVASIPVQKFTSRSEADVFIRSQEDRSRFLTQKDEASGQYVVAEIKPAAMVRDDLGNIQRFKSYDEAAAVAKEKGNAQPVGFVKEKGKSGQEFVVIKGITPEEAKRMQADASFTEFYDPVQGSRTSSDTQAKLKENGIEIQAPKTERDLSNDLFIDPPQVDDVELGKMDGTVETVKAEADDAMKMLNDLYPDANEEYSAIFEGMDQMLDDAKVEAQGWKYLGNCMLKNQ